MILGCVGHLPSVCSDASTADVQLSNQASWIARDDGRDGKVDLCERIESQERRRGLAREVDKRVLPSNRM
ncbi:hypothetical protein ARMGADRAFT_1009217 [Armillaria gallica]|uniref:Uncharacterized protein n=1 Tax=Armillaria gallica TaxID=47427 RepID=A0A2H3DY99_ARMGA|nr:hypothetical protein ARMGADRAFT_1009217 [Armillaria gallica]